MKADVNIVGAGLAGCEAAHLLAKHGFTVSLWEMRPTLSTPAHKTALFGELVCSNSLKSDIFETPQGLLKAELEATGSLIMEAARASAIPAGQALAVDRNLFAEYITARIREQKNISVINREFTDFEGNALTIVAAGPLASYKLVSTIARLTGRESLYFYDAISPIVDAESIDFERAFRASRYEKGGDDYINCPMNKSEYKAFREALLEAVRIAPRPFEEDRYFESCLPLEVIAERGEKTLAYGPFKPVGLTDPKTGETPYAVLQLRAENLHKTAYSLVACQTRLAYGEQKRIFRMIPGLEKASFLRYGSIHRNTYINSPILLGESLELRGRPHIRFAGQIAGVEGYLESSAMGLWAAMAIVQREKGGQVSPPPPESAIGALHKYLMGGELERRRFEPMNINLSIFPPLKESPPKEDKKRAFSERGLRAFEEWLKAFNS